MRRTMLAVFVAGTGLAGTGLFASLAGQAIWRRSPDEIWAACAVVGVLSAMAIGFESQISKVLTRARRS